MANPNVTFWKVNNTNPTGTVGGVNINTMGRNQTGDVSTTSLATGYLDFGNVEAGMWSLPQVLLVEFTNNTASNLAIKLYDTDSQVDLPIQTTQSDYIADSSGNMNWTFRILLAKDFRNPGEIAVSEITSSPWQDLRAGANTFALDTNRPNPGNDGLGNLLTAYVNNGGGNDTNRHLTNFFLYIAGKPPSSANAGDQQGWGLRISYTYPQP